jgi:hypothetical protein
MLSGTSIEIMGHHGDIHDQCKECGCRADHIVLDLNVSVFISRNGCNFVGFNPVSNRTKQQTELIHDPVVCR